MFDFQLSPIGSSECKFFPTDNLSPLQKDLIET
jgi:hypothetical protein